MSREEVSAALRNLQLSLDSLQRELDGTIRTLPETRRASLPEALATVRRSLARFSSEQLAELDSFAQEAGLELPRDPDSADEEGAAAPAATPNHTQTAPFEARDKDREGATPVKAASFADSGNGEEEGTPTKAASFKDNGHAVEEPAPAKAASFKDDAGEEAAPAKAASFKDDAGGEAAPAKAASFKDNAREEAAPAKVASFKENGGDEATPLRAASFEGDGGAEEEEEEEELAATPLPSKAWGGLQPEATPLSATPWGGLQLKSLDARVAQMGGIPALGACVLPKMTPGQRPQLAATASPAAREIMRGRLGKEDAAPLRKTGSNADKESEAAHTPLVQLRATPKSDHPHHAPPASPAGALPLNTELAAAIARRMQRLNSATSSPEKAAETAAAAAASLTCGDC